MLFHNVITKFFRFIMSSGGSWPVSMYTTLTTLLLTCAILDNFPCAGFTINTSKQFGKPLKFAQTWAGLKRKTYICSSSSENYKQQTSLLAVTDGEPQILINHTSVLEVYNDKSQQLRQQIEEDSEEEKDSAGTLLLALVVGATTGLGVSLFKLSIDEVRQFAYSLDLVQYHASAFQAAFIPAVGGLIVSLLALTGEFSPGIRGHVAEVDADCLSNNKQVEIKSPLRYLRKSSAAVATLGTGCSLGPEGPAVEVGLSTSRVILNADIFQEKFNLSRKQQRLILSCGASAGVSAGFNAPIAAVFFALEVIQAALLAESKEKKLSISDGEDSVSSRESIAAILLASVMSAGVARQILSDHLTLKLSSYSLSNPFLELPLYLLLGSLCGLTAFTFSQFSKIVKDAFEGPGPLGQIPPFFRPVFGGLVSGVVGLAFPQILFFGYETLNALLANKALPTETLVELLFVKMFTTAVAAGSGLVGGTFAPSLFLGGMLGASFHNAVSGVLNSVNILGSTVFTIADVPAYAMVGGASVLAALFRAPLTGSLLVFELAGDYNVILPLMASAGAASILADVIESKFKAVEKRKSLNAVSWGDLATTDDAFSEENAFSEKINK